MSTYFHITLLFRLVRASVSLTGLFLMSFIRHTRKKMCFCVVSFNQGYKKVKQATDPFCLRQVTLCRSWDLDERRCVCISPVGQGYKQGERRYRRLLWMLMFPMPAVRLWQKFMCLHFPGGSGLKKVRQATDPFFMPIFPLPAVGLERKTMFSFPWWVRVINRMT